MTISKAEVLRIEAMSRRYVRSFDKKKLYYLSREVILAIGYEAGLKSRAGVSVKPRTPTTKVFVKPKEQ